MDEAAAAGVTGPKPAIDAAGLFLLVLTLFVFLLPIILFFPPVPPTLTDAILATCSRIGLEEDESNLPGHAKPKRRSRRKKAASSSTPPIPTSGPRIQSLWVYPIKSCKGVEVRESKVLPHGLEFDRLFTLAQLKSPFPVGLDTPAGEKAQHKWEFITQRQFPLLATLQVDLYAPDLAKLKGAPARPSDAYLVIRFPWRELGWRGVLALLFAKMARGRDAVPEMEVVLPLNYPSEKEAKERGYVMEEVEVWKKTVMALNMDIELPNELRLYLGVSNKLGIFRFDPEVIREVHGCAPEADEAGYQPHVYFHDSYPLHLLGLPSVQAFDAKVPKDETLAKIDPRRFRANIYVDGVPAYDEDSWKMAKFKPTGSSRREECTMHVSCRTSRCKLPNTDQDTGVKHPIQPDKSLRAFREIDEGAKHKGCMGMQLTPLFEKGSQQEDMIAWIEAGMSVEVLERGEHFFIG